MTVLNVALNIALTLLTASAVVQIIITTSLQKKVKTMSQELDKLTADVAAAVTEITSLKAENAALTTASAAKDAQIADLTAQLAAATATQGTPDAALAALDAQLETALAPAAPAPVTPPDPAPAA